MYCSFAPLEATWSQFCKDIISYHNCSCIRSVFRPFRNFLTILQEAVTLKFKLFFQLWANLLWSYSKIWSSASLKKCPNLRFAIATLKRYYSRSVSLKKWELLEVIKRCPDLVPQFPLSAKIDLVRLTPYHRQSCVSNFRDIRSG